MKRPVLSNPARQMLDGAVPTAKACTWLLLALAANAGAEYLRTSARDLDRWADGAAARAERHEQQAEAVLLT